MVIGGVRGRQERLAALDPQDLPHVAIRTAASALIAGSTAVSSATTTSTSMIGLAAEAADRGAAHVLGYVRDAGQRRVETVTQPLEHPWPSSGRTPRQPLEPPCCHHAAAASRARTRPRDQQRPMASAGRADIPNSARPIMLWPEAGRSPRVGIVGATPTPSADTHPTARPAATSSRRCTKRRRVSGENRDSAHFVVTTGRAFAGTRAMASGSSSAASPLSSSGGPPPPAPAPRRAARSARADPGAGRRAASGRSPRRSRRSGRGRRRPGRRPRVSPGSGRAGGARSREQLHGRGRVAERWPVAVGDADAIDVEIKPGRTADVDQPDGLRPRPARRFGDGRVEHGVASGLVGPDRSVNRDVRDRVGHSQQRVDRRADGSAAAASSASALAAA